MVFIRQNIREARALYRSNALPIAPQSHVRELQRRVNTLIRHRKVPEAAEGSHLKRIYQPPDILLIQ